MSTEGRRGSLAVSAALTSAAQALAMVSGGVLAVLVAIRVGVNAETDGFFAAYGVYSVTLLFAQSARTTVVARIVEAGDPLEGLDRFLGSALVVFLGFGLLFVPLGSALASLLTGDLPDVAHETATTTLLILWPATGIQLFAALAAALLGLRGSFGLAALGFGGGSLASIVAFLVLEPPLGIDALPLSILLGATLTGAVLAYGLLREGWRPGARIVGNAWRGGPRGAGVLVASSVSFLLQQLAFLVSLAVAARIGSGVVTSYSYAYAAIGLLIALPSSVSIVLAAPLASDWDRREESLLVHHRAIAAAALLIVVPVAAGAWLLGPAVGAEVLRGFEQDEVDLTVTLFLILLPTVVATGALSVPLTALFTLGRLGPLAIASAILLAVHSAACVAAGALDSEELLAAAASLGAVVSVFVVFALVSRRYLGMASAAIGAVVARVVAAGAVAFVPLALLLNAADVPAADWLAFAGGFAVFALIVRTLLPAERDVSERLVRALLPG